jgi:energy-coupling factor transporter ATP-binding protein EcfA2
MNVVNTIYSLEDVKNFSDDELYQRLFECWNITNGKIEVWGELQVSSDGKWAGIKKIKTISENREVSYPVQIRHNIDNGVYVGPGYAKSILKEDTNIWVTAELIFTSEAIRKDKGNRFDLTVKGNSLVRLVSMPLDKNDVISDGETTYISDTIYKEVYDFHVVQLNTKINKNKIALELELKENTDLFSEKLKNAKTEYSQASDNVIKLTNKNSHLEKNNTQLEKNINVQQQALVELTHQYEKVEEEMSQKINKLKNYISDKASFLKDFEFIDEEDFDSFILNVAPESATQEGISFQDVLGGDYAKAVSYIQAFLKDRDILYPRHIIENYLTLIRANDLIILAGDSGSGKTNLVQSFAEAVGGVSKIIPVKPNWTSSEDLLGYYNPLEKKYLATPFLEALIEAQQHPDIPYFICLDEMNLARVEYYFADFLSKLEARDSTPEIQLYSDTESAHVLSELKAVVSIISDAKSKFSKEGVVDFVKLMQDEDVNAEMKKAFGFSDKDSLIKYHGDIRRMLTGIISTPSKISIPANVRIIGAINIDETTHYLSPKILDRAHIMKFKSPLLTEWDDIFAEIEANGFDDVSKPIIFNSEELGQRKTYPKFDRTDPFCNLFVDLNKVFFDRLDVEFGMRTVRQGLNYIALFAELNDNSEQAINNFIIHKVLPKFTFDGNKQSGDLNKIDLLDKGFLPRLESIVTSHESLPVEFSSIAALKSIISNAKANDGVVNYWA